MTTENSSNMVHVLCFQAEGGRGLPEEILDDDSTFADAVKFYFMFIRFDWIWFLNHFALLYLNFLEVGQVLMCYWYFLDAALWSLGYKCQYTSDSNAIFIHCQYIYIELA